MPPGPSRRVRVRPRIAAGFLVLGPRPPRGRGRSPLPEVPGGGRPETEGAPDRFPRSSTPRLPARPADPVAAVRYPPAGSGDWPPPRARVRAAPSPAGRVRRPPAGRARRSPAGRVRRLSSGLRSRESQDRPPPPGARGQCRQSQVEHTRHDPRLYGNDAKRRSGGMPRQQRLPPRPEEHRDQHRDDRGPVAEGGRPPIRDRLHRTRDLEETWQNELVNTHNDGGTGERDSGIPGDPEEAVLDVNEPPGGEHSHGRHDEACIPPTPARPLADQILGAVDHLVVIAIIDGDLQDRRYHGTEP